MEYYGDDYRSYLAHYGVLGMKWGIRRFQPYSVHPRKGGEGGKEVGEAKKGQEKLAKKVSRKTLVYNAKTYPREDNYKLKIETKLDAWQPKLERIPEIKKAYKELSTERKRLEDANSDMQDFLNLNRKDMQKYLDKAADRSFEKHKYNFKPDGISKEDYREIYEQERYYLRDDPKNGPFALYLKDKGKTYKSIQTKSDAARKRYNKKSADMTNELLGEYGSRKIRRTDKTVKEVVEYVLDRNYGSDHDVRNADDLMYRKLYGL